MNHLFHTHFHSVETLMAGHSQEVVQHNLAMLDGSVAASPVTVELVIDVRSFVECCWEPRTHN